MLLQLQHLHADDKCDFIAQGEFPDGWPFDDSMLQNEFNQLLREWSKGVKDRHPLPDGCEWLLCLQDTPEFQLGRANDFTSTTSGGDP